MHVMRSEADLPSVSETLRRFARTLAGRLAVAVADVGRALDPACAPHTDLVRAALEEAARGDLRRSLRPEVTAAAKSLLAQIAAKSLGVDAAA